MAFRQLQTSKDCYKYFFFPTDSSRVERKTSVSQMVVFPQT